MGYSFGIIGASGFIGQGLARTLVASGHTVYALSRRGSSIPGSVWIPTDVLRDIPLPGGLDGVFYLAQSSRYRDFPEGAEDLFGVNAFGALKAAKVALASGCRFFCYASTGSVYAPSFHPLDETSLVDRSRPYGLSKLMGEEGAACFSPGMSVISARIFGAFGPGQQAMLPTTLYNRVLNGEPIELAAGPEGDDGGLRISFMFIDDLCRCLLALAVQSFSGTPLPPVCNLAGPEGVSIRAFAESMARLMGNKAFFTASSLPRNGDLVADVSLLKSCIRPNFTSFEDAMERAYDS